MKFTIEPDRALADRLNPTRDDWQQIYQLLKAQKTAIQSDSGVRIFIGVGCGRAQPPLLALGFCKFLEL